MNKKEKLKIKERCDEYINLFLDTVNEVLAKRREALDRCNLLFGCYVGDMLEDITMLKSLKVLVDDDKTKLRKEKSLWEK